jgi:hypothetical protein
MRTALLLSILCAYATYCMEVTRLLAGWRSRDNLARPSLRSEVNLMDSGYVVFEEHYSVKGHALSLVIRVATRNRLIQEL